MTNKANGEPLFGALVVAEGPKRGQANTCMQGHYYIGELPPGTYLVVAQARGFHTSPPETVAWSPNPFGVGESTESACATRVMAS